MSLNTTKTNYNKAYKIYDKLNNQWSKIESGQSKDSDFEINQLLLDLRKFRKYLNGVYIDDLKGKIPKESIDQVKHNMSLFNEAHYHIERKIKGIKYYDDIILPLGKFIEDQKLSLPEYKKWARTEEELIGKFAAVITHVDNVLEYENEIRRMSKGKMSPKEFKKIFDTLKYDMIPVPGMKFQSIEDFSRKQSRLGRLNQTREATDKQHAEWLASNVMKSQAERNKIRK
jgi:hypothetical protein